MGKNVSDRDLIIATIKARAAENNKKYNNLLIQIEKLHKEMDEWSEIINDDLKKSNKALNEANKTQKTTNRLYAKLEKKFEALFNA